MLTLIVILFIASVIFSSTTAHYKALSEKDTFTGCYNKEWAIVKRNSKLVQMMRKTQKNGEEFGLLFIDIDNFKKINDTKGHFVGDNTIKSIVKNIRSCLGKKGILVRFGGDEFMVILPLPDGWMTMDYLAEDIRDTIFHSNLTTVSIGGTVFTKNMPVNVEELINAADANVYRAKKNGRDCVVI